MKLRIKSFKNFDRLSLTLKPLTVIIGPPASGKSNLLEALALLGLPGKLLALSEQYINPNYFCQAEPAPSDILRIQNALEVFPWMDYRSPATIELLTRSQHVVRTRLVLRGSGLYAEYNIIISDDESIEFRLPIYDLRKDPCITMIGVSHELSEEAGPDMVSAAKDVAVEARLYGYERYSIESKIDDVTVCGDESCMQPRDVLVETGYNLAYTAYNSPLPLRWLQEWLQDDLGAPIKIHVTRRPWEVLFFSREIEVPSRLLSDTLLRVLYYLLALYTAARYTRLYSLQGRMLVLLEEPEARAFPYSFGVVTRGIREALDAGVYIVLTTHNGLLLSKLLDTAREDELAVYYMYLDSEGYSHALRVDVAALAEKMLLLEDLLVMKPGEVLQELGGKEEGGQQQ